MQRWALIDGGVVASIVEQDSQPTIGGLWVDVTGQHVGPGNTYSGGVFGPAPAPPPIITKVAMLTGRFTNPEFVGILTASKTDVEVEAWKYVFDNAPTIDLDSQNTKDGMALLVRKGLLTQERADQILTDPVQESERP
jgi:hypothetical protein